MFIRKIVHEFPEVFQIWVTYDINETEEIRSQCYVAFLWCFHSHKMWFVKEACQDSIKICKYINSRLVNFCCKEDLISGTTQIAFKIVSMLARCRRCQNDIVPTAADIETTLVRFGMLSSFRFHDMLYSYIIEPLIPVEQANVWGTVPSRR